jgi:hypothetical protein
MPWEEPIGKRSVSDAIAKMRFLFRKTDSQEFFGS